MSSQLLASAYDVLSGPANGLLGRAGDDDGANNLPSLTALGNLSTWYDVSDVSSMTLDSSNRCQLLADKSGNSTENCLLLPGVAGNYASFTALTAFGTGDFSVSAKITVSNLTNSVLVFGGGANGFGFKINATTGKLESVKILVGGGGLSTGAVFALQEAVIGYTRTGTTAKYYIDGVLVGSKTDGNDYTVGVSELGSTSLGTTSNVYGNIKWARVYSTALDATAMAADAAGTIQANNTFAVDFSDYAKFATSVVASTGQTVTINSTAIALPARIHGARDLYMGTVASQPTYLPYAGKKYGYSNGVTGNYFSTPAAAVNQLTDTVELIAHVEVSNWAPSSSTYYIGRWTGSTPSRAYALLSRGSIPYNRLSFIATDGTTQISVDSDTHSLVDGTAYWIKSQYTKDTGSGEYLVRFYYAASQPEKPTSWTKLGADKTGTSIGDITSAGGVAVEVFSAFGGNPATAGNVYYASLGGTLDGDPDQVFNAADYTSSTSFTSSATGETWTVNGGAKIVTRSGLYFDGSADYMKTAPFALSQPENVYFVGEQVTWTSTDYLIDGAATNSGAITQTTSTPQLNISAGTSVAANTGLAVQTAGVVNAVFNGASSSLRINRATATTGNAGAANMAGLTVASAGTAGTYGNLFLSEALIYDTTAQDAATKDRVTLYEGQKWGIIV